MSWRDNLLPASFRGVPFFIKSSDYVTGRRSNQHEFPDRNDPYAEDLGKISDTFTVDGHIIGDDYFQVRNQMIEAVQKEGPGELIHPYYGVRFVQCGSASFKEDQEEGRIVRFSVTFREAGENRFPKSANDKGAKLLEETDAAIAEAQNEFEQNFDLENQPGFSLDAVRGWIASAQGAFDSATKDVATVADGIAELAFSTRNLVAETEDLLRSPSVLANRLLNSLELLSGAVTNAKDAYNSYQNLFNFGEDDPEPIETTPTRRTIAQNKLTYDRYLRTVAAIKGVEEAANAEWDSISEASQARDELLEVFEQVLETTNNDELYQALKDVSATLVNLLPDEDSELPQIETIELQATRDTLTLTYDLFESVEPEQSIIERNNITAPAFVKIGTELEVLNDRRRTQG